MKLTKLFTVAFLSVASSALGEEAVIPTGFLDASALLVRENSSVDLNWEVKIPATRVEELVDISGDDPTVVARDDVAFTVRMLGVEYAHQSEYVLAWGYYTYANSPWYTFFWGYGDDEYSLANQSCDILRTGEKLRFGFRGSKNGFRSVEARDRVWFDHRWTGTGPSYHRNETPAIILKNGDTLPDRVTPSGQIDVSNFLASYLEDDGRTVKIGPKDLIVLAELNRDFDDPKADYQDFVILVSFTEEENSDCIRRWDGTRPPQGGGGGSRPAPRPTPHVPGLPE